MPTGGWGTRQPIGSRGRMKIRALEGVRVDRTQPNASSHWVRRRHDAIALAAGLVVLAAGMIAVRNGSVSGFEKSVFHAINDLPRALYPVLWPVQQLGAILVGPIVAAAAALFRRFRLAIALLIATAAKLLLERAVKAIVSRERPGTSIGPDIHLRGTVSLTGESFVSGHPVLVTAIAGLVSPYLRAAGRSFRGRSLVWRWSHACMSAPTTRST